LEEGSGRETNVEDKDRGWKVQLSLCVFLSYNRELGSASRASLKPPSKDGSGREGGRERSDSVFSLLSTTSSVASFASYSSSDVSEEGQGGKEEGREEGREEGKEEVGGDGSEEQDERGGKETQTAEATEVGDGGKVKPKTYYAVRFEEHWTSSLSASPPTASRDDHSGPKHRQDNIRGGFTVLSLVPTPGKVGGREGAAGEEAEEEVVAELEKYLSQTTAPSSLETFPALSSSVSARSQSHQRVLKASLCVVNPPTPLLAHALSAFEKVVVEWEVSGDEASSYVPAPMWVGKLQAKKERENRHAMNKCRLY
jgi:hypothetical protein